LAPLLAGTSSAYADATCPSSWGFDGGYFVGLNPQAAVPGWFGGNTDCSVRLQSFDNWSTVTDKSTGSTVATTDHYTCGSANSGCATWGIGVKSLFAPTPGHSYRGDYFVVLEARAGSVWVSWPSDCSVGSTKTVLTCDYHSDYPTTPRLAPAAARATTVLALASR
jgi:hypothetical protein